MAVPSDALTVHFQEHHSAKASTHSVTNLAHEVAFVTFVDLLNDQTTVAVHLMPVAAEYVTKLEITAVQFQFVADEALLTGRGALLVRRIQHQIRL